MVANKKLPLNYEQSYQRTTSQYSLLCQWSIFSNVSFFQKSYARIIE
jgi:hypothetical protein